MFWENEVFLKIAVLKVASCKLLKFAVKILEKYLWKGLSLVKLQAFQNTYFPEHVSVAAFKPIQEILLIILKLLKRSTRFSLLDEVWWKELPNISISVDIWHPLLA